MTQPTDATFERELRRFLAARADELAGRSLSASEVALRLGGTASRPIVGLRVLLVTALLVFAALVVALLAGTVTRRPDPLGPISAIPGGLAWSPDGRTLAFTVAVDAHSAGSAAKSASSRFLELWAVAADGSNPRRLGRDAVESISTVSPAAVLWSPDGRFVAYEADLGEQRVVVQELSGASARFETEGWPYGWAPNADRLLVGRAVGDGMDVYVVGPGGAASIALTSSHAAGVPSWSPDGSLILYADGLLHGGATTESHLWVVAPDGTNRRQVAAPCCDLGWSADGRLIYYLAGASELHSVAPDGTHDEVVQAGFAWYGWSGEPNGSRFVSSSAHGLVVFEPGGQSTTVTSDAADWTPSWSPGGAAIAFWGTRPEGSGLFTIPVAGGKPRLVGDAALEIGGVAWQPFAGDRLAFVRDLSVVIVNADGSAAADLVPSTTFGQADARGSVGSPRMILGREGPDHPVYRVGLAPNFKFMIENPTDSAWNVAFEGLGVEPTDCKPVDDGAELILAAARQAGPAARPILATPADYCHIDAHQTVELTKQLQTNGSFLMRIERQAGGQANGAVSFYALLDFEPAP